ncbi:hypothetical protein [Acidisphaera sp. S103]|uniref:hypothetical protein n=1 Tax=Acidisphaera sp. S103 TaxID=1747223 RepID=UPI00131D8650|nr:hypothetical protein [Acidisphaera sp. S103]
MQTRSADPAGRAAHALRHQLRQADDQKIIRITAMLDDVADPAGKQAILDPLRDRLGSLKPVRPLRFARLLFTPFEPVIVPPSAWRPGDVAIPRSVLTPLSAVVRTGFGAEASAIDAIIASHKTDATDVVTVAGLALWPRAAELLAVSPTPGDWETTGLRSTVYPPLAGAVVTVPRRAAWLRCLARDQAIGALAADQRTIENILRSMADEPPEGCAMVVALILLQAPHAVPVLRECVASVRNAAEKAILLRALARGMEQVLTRLEAPSGVMDEIARAPLAAAGQEVRRIAAFLGEMDNDSGAAAHRPRLKAMRERLDQACRERFAEGLAEGLVQPLATASDALDAAGQTLLETCARDLRSLETVARKVGGSGSYDQLLHQAADTVLVAAKSGTLTPIRTFRLVEILAGSDVATSMYRDTVAKS